MGNAFMILNGESPLIIVEFTDDGALFKVQDSDGYPMIEPIRVSDDRFRIFLRGAVQKLYWEPFWEQVEADGS